MKSSLKISKTALEPLYNSLYAIASKIDTE